MFFLAKSLLKKQANVYTAVVYCNVPLTFSGQNLVSSQEHLIPQYCRTSQKSKSCNAISSTVIKYLVELNSLSNLDALKYLQYFFQ